MENRSQTPGTCHASTPDPDAIDWSSPTAPTTDPDLPNRPAPDHDSPVYNEMNWYAETQAQDDSSDDSVTPRFGKCMHCSAVGYKYTMCNKCDDNTLSFHANFPFVTVFLQFWHYGKTNDRKLNQAMMQDMTLSEVHIQSILFQFDVH